VSPEEILERWRSLAAELELDPDSVSLAQVGLDGSEGSPLAAVEAGLDELVGLLRWPRWRVDRDAGRIVRDPWGSDDLAGLARDLADHLAQQATRERRRGAVEEVRSGALSHERVAARWGISARQLFRWAALERRTAIREGSMSSTVPDSEATIVVTGSATTDSAVGAGGSAA
jgi:hypothetical protein